MKTTVAAFIAQQGLSAHYSGKKRKMFIKGKGARRVADLVKAAFINLEFKISYS
jgi:hypothetical protein